MTTSTTEIKWVSVPELPVGALFRYRNAIELGLDEVQKKVSDTHIQRIKPASDAAYAAPIDDLLKVALLEQVPEVQAVVKIKTTAKQKAKRKAKAKTPAKNTPVAAPEAKVVSKSTKKPAKKAVAKTKPVTK